MRLRKMDARDEKLPNEDLLEKLNKLMRRESTKNKRASFHERVALSDDEQRDAEHDRQRRTSVHKELPRMEERRPSIDRHGRRSSIDKKFARIPIDMRSRKVSIDLRALNDAAKQESQSVTQRDARERPSPTQSDRSPDKDVDQRATDHSASHRNSLKSHSQETLVGKGGSQTDITVVRSLSQLSAHIRRLEAEEAPKQTRARASFDVRRPSGEGYRGAPPEALAAGRGPQTPRPAARAPLQRRLTPPVVLLTGQEGAFEAVFPHVVKDRMRPDSPDGSSRVCRGLRFSPAAIVFKNVFKGERRALRFVLQNVSERPICISVLDSSSVFFSLKKQVYDQVLAPGLRHENVITLQQYSWRSGSILNASIAIIIDSVPEEYTVETHFAAPLLEVEPAELDFGVLNVAAPVMVRFVTVRNVGRLSTNFCVDPGSDTTQLTVRPLRGKLQAHSAKCLRCEFAPSIPGDFVRAMWVRGGGSACRIPITARIVHPRLEISYPLPGGEGKYVLLNFGSVYYGAQSRLVTTVHNCSSDICTFVVMAEMPNGRLMTLQDARSQYPRLRVFGAHPPEGRIQCMESRIFTFGFDPQQCLVDEYGQLAKKAQDFQIFVRVLRVACIDYGIERAQKENEIKQIRKDSDDILTGAMELFMASEAAQLRQREENAARDSFVRVCLHGRAAPLALRLTPRALQLGRVALGATERRVLRLANGCARLPLLFRVARPPPPGVRVRPTHGALKPGGAVELLVQVAPVAFGTRRLQLRLELLSASLPLLAPEEQALLGSRVVRIVYECPAELPPPQPRVAAGLSPIINRQVGVVGDGVPFCSDVPKPAMAMLGAYALARRNYKWGPLQHARARTTSDSKESDSVCDSKCEQCPEPSTCVNTKPKENERTSETPPSDSSDDDDDFPGQAEREGQDVERLLVPVLPSDTPGVFIEPAAPEADAGREGFTEAVEEALQYEDYEVGDKASSPIEDAGEPAGERENDEQHEPLSAPWAAVPESADVELAVPAEPVTSPASYPIEKETSQAGSTSSGKKVRLSVPLVTVAKPTTLPVEFSEKARKGSEETQKQNQANATGCPAAVAHAPGRPTLGGRVTPGWLGYRPANKECGARETLHVGKLASDAVQNRLKSLTEPTPPPPTPSAESEFSIQPHYLPVRTPSSSTESLLNSKMQIVVRRRQSATHMSPLKTSATIYVSPVWEPATSCYMTIADTTTNTTSTTDVSQFTSNSSSDSSSLENESREPPQPPPATPMALMEEAVAKAKKLLQQPSGAAETEQQAQRAAEVQNTHALRCEALKWARGEQLHPHCAFIAFPNDTEQRSLRPWPSNRLTRTIFTGEARYAAPPDAAEAATAREVLARAARADEARRVLRAHGDRVRAAALAAVDRPPAPEYDVSKGDLYNLQSFQPWPPELSAPYAESPSVAHASALVPLTPSQLLNVRLIPAVIDFGTVSIGSRVSVLMRVANDNTVLVKLNVSTPSHTLSVPGNGVVYVPPQGKTNVKVTLKTQLLGKFNGLLRYVVNDSHAFEAPVTADVVLRTLQLPNAEQHFGFVHGFEEAWPKITHVIPIKNPLQVSCRFEWTAIDKTCYDVLPRFGSVPAKGTYACEITYRVNSDAQSPHAELVLTTDSDRYLQLPCHLLAPPDNCLNAGFVRSNMMLPDLSVMGKRQFILQVYNASYLETLFRVLNSASSDDSEKDERGSARNKIAWKVRPSRGTLRPRSVRQLFLTVRSFVPGRVTFRVRLALGMDAFAPSTARGSRRASRLSTSRRYPVKVAVQTLSAHIVYPQIVAEPEALRFQRVPAGTREVRELVLSNAGTAEASVGLDAEASALSSGEWALSLREDCPEPAPLPLLMLPRGPPLRLFLHFCPLDLATYAFVLPLTINEHLGPPEMGDNVKGMRRGRAGSIVSGLSSRSSRSVAGGGDRPFAPMKLPYVLVEATVSRRILTFSQTELLFRYNAANPSENITERELSVQNRRSDPVLMWLPCKLPNNAPFSVTAPLGGPETLRRASLGGRRVVMATKTSENTLQSKLETFKSLLGSSQITLLSMEPSEPIWETYVSNSFLTPFEEEEKEEVMVYSCTMAPNDICYFSIRFEPGNPGTFTAELPVYVGGIRNNEMPLEKLMLHAYHNAPSLSLPITELHLSPRPLNISAEARLLLTVTDHIGEPNITWTIEDVGAEKGRAPKDCLQVHVEGKRERSSSNNTHVPITVVFKSSSSLGMRARIVFSSGAPPRGATCSLDVTALADTSILTTHHYLHVSKPLFDEEQTLSAPPGRTPQVPRGARRNARLRAIVRCATLYSDEEYEDTASEDEEPKPPRRHSRQRGASLLSMLSSYSTTSLVSGLTGPSNYPQGPLRLRRSAQRGRPRTHCAGMDVGGLVCKTPSSGSLVDHGSFCVGAGSATNVVPVHSHSSRLVLSLDSSGDPDFDSPPSSGDSSSSSDDLEDNMTAASRCSVDDLNCSYPFFPDATDISDSAQYMRRVQQAIEEWLYDIVFQRHYWVSLPDGLNQLYRTGRSGQEAVKEEADPRRPPKRPKRPSCPFNMNTSQRAVNHMLGKSAVEFIYQNMPKGYEDWSYGEANLIIPGYTYEGPAQEDAQNVSDPPLREMAEMQLRRYTLFLHILRCNGAVLPHVRPEHFLGYNMYRELVIASENRPPSEDTDSADSPTSRVSWRDMAKQWKTPLLSEEADTGQSKPLDLGLTVPGPMLSRTRHRQLSRQAWLDTSLQWARTFWLPRIDTEHYLSQEAFRTSRRVSVVGELQFRSRQYLVGSAAHYSDQELCLLAWLNERYAHACQTLGDRVKAPPQRRNITNFENDLADAVVLAYVTLDACPYVLDFMPDIFPQPTNLEQAQHNAARAVAVWTKLRLGFTVCVRDLVRPLAVKMVLLVAFLYNVLPVMSARASMRLTAPLSDRARVTLGLVNPSSYRLHYLAEFLGEAGSFFSVLGGGVAPVPYAGADAGVDTSGVYITLNPRQQLKLSVEFQSRSFSAQSCVLLLTGTMQATRFGRSLALRLEGQPSSIAVSATVLIKAPLYKPTQHTIKLPLPYSSFFNADQLHDFPEFDLYLTESMPSVEEPFSGCAWSELQSRKELRRLFLNQTTAKVEMVAAEPKKKPYHLRRSATRTRKVTQERVPTSKLSVTMCAFTPHVRDYWIGCVSPKVGDFIIKVVTKPSKCRPLATLPFALPREWRESQCTCGGRFYGADALVPCPLITHVKVPCTNPALRTAANCMFMKTLNEYEMEFWQEHLESSVGLRLMQLELVKDEHITDEYAHIFNTNVDYSVEILKNDYLTAPVQLHIPDVLSGDHVPLLLHVNNATSSFMQWHLQLSSADGRELRTYTLQAVLPPGEEEALEAQSSVEAIPGSFRTRSQLYSELIRERMKLLSRSSRRSSHIRRSKNSEKSITSQTLQTNKTCETARTSQTDRSSRASRTCKAIVTSQTGQTHRTRWKCTTNGASRSRRSSRALHQTTGSQSLCRKSDCSCASRLCPQNRAGEQKK